MKEASQFGILDIPEGLEAIKYTEIFGYLIEKRKMLAIGIIRSAEIYENNKLPFVVCNADPEAPIVVKFLPTLK